MTKIAIVVGSVRAGERVSRVIAEWIKKTVSEKAEAEIVDLRDYPMSLFDESGSPRYNPARKPSAEAQKWMNKITEFDGYFVVTPEYNRSTSAALKNAIDHIDYQMDKKPVALVGHGSSGGAQAIANLRMSFPGIGVVTIPTALFLQNTLTQNIKEGTLEKDIAEQPYGPQMQLNGQITELLWYTEALKSAKLQK